MVQKLYSPENASQRFNQLFSKCVMGQGPEPKVSELNNVNDPMTLIGSISASLYQNMFKLKSTTENKWYL